MRFRIARNPDTERTLPHLLWLPVDGGLVLKARDSALLKQAHAPTGFLPDLLARVQVRYPEIPIVFLETRAFAEEWANRWLGAALIELRDDPGG